MQRIADMSQAEFRQLIKEVVEDVMREALEQKPQLGDTWPVNFFGFFEEKRGKR